MWAGFMYSRRVQSDREKLSVKHGDCKTDFVETTP